MSESHGLHIERFVCEEWFLARKQGMCENFRIIWDNICDANSN